MGGAAAAGSDPEWIATPPEHVYSSAIAHSRQPAIATGAGGRMVVAWSEGDSANIYYALSTHYGPPWTTSPRVLASTPGDSRLCDALIFGDRTFVAWRDQAPDHTVLVYEAEIGGSGGVRQVPIPVASNVSTRPDLAGAGSQLHIVLSAGDEGQPHIYHASRALGGAWPAAARIYTSTATYGSWYPTLAASADGGTLHVVWEDRNAALIRAIMYISGTVSGSNVTWHTAKMLSSGTVRSVWPTIAMDSSGNLHVVWGEVTEQGQVARYTRWSVTSRAWITPALAVDPQPVLVNNIDPTETAPSLTLLETDAGLQLCVAWHGMREMGGAEEVLISCSNDGGNRWQTPSNVSRSTLEISLRPAIAFDANGGLHSVWEERVPTYYDVLYSQALNAVFLPLVMRR